ncbi:hypothetical protein Zmor_023125 [Zophobas morio]|uniref:Uncharacterized protein n=1 Tax=Zophobas morio TaxID=2755281 RepID=A0AA38HWK2_9CUCU|nr:hypothetical protein Zmor_023125 [Zophobas morio]
MIHYFATKFRMGGTNGPVTARNLADNVWGGGVLGCQALGRLVSLMSETRLVDQAYAATFTPPGVAPSVRSGGSAGASSLSGGGSAGVL